MAERLERELRFKVGRRNVTVTAYDTVGVEDAYSVAIAGVLHRLAVNEDLVQPVSREVKDWLIKQNLFI
jgi:hypothetical protein